MTKAEKIIFATSQQKVLLYLVDHPTDEFTEKEITGKIDVKKSAVNIALRALADAGLISRRKIGRMSLYMADLRNNIVREIKIARNILKISSLISELKKTSDKIVLFGSVAYGTNTNDSDVDLFVLSAKPDSIRKIINDSSFSEKIQLIVKSPKEMIAVKKKNILLFSEIEKGRTLWEKNE